MNARYRIEMIEAPPEISVTVGKADAALFRVNQCGIDVHQWPCFLK